MSCWLLGMCVEVNDRTSILIPHDRETEESVNETTCCLYSLLDFGLSCKVAFVSPTEVVTPLEERLVWRFRISRTGQRDKVVFVRV